MEGMRVERSDKETQSGEKIKREEKKERAGV